MIDTRTNTGKAAFTGALAAVVVGVCVLAGWLFDLEFLKRIAPGFVAMNPATAVAFILAGASLALFLRSPHGRDQKSRALILTARLCALVVTLIGLAKLVGILGGWDLGVDRWLFASKLPDDLRFPNRIAPNTALSFLLLGSALLLVDVKKRSVRICVEFSVVVVGFGSLLAVLAYAYDLQSFYGLSVFIPMALHTAITFSVLVVVFLLSHTDSGLLAVFAGDSAGGKMARRLLPAAVLVPAVLGWLTRQGEEAGIYHGGFSNAVFAVESILVFTFLVCWSAKGLSSADLVRKKAEAAMRESEERFRIAAETANDVVYEWDLKQSLEWLGKIDDLLGYAPGEFPRTLNGWAASVHPEDLERTTAAIQAHLEGRGPYAIEYRVRRKDGVYRWWSARGAVARTPDGKPTRWIGSITDITERKQAENALRESNEKFHQLADNITDAFWIRSPDMREVHYISPAFERIWGRSVESLYANPQQWADFILPEDRERVLGAFAALTGDAPSLDIEYRIVRPDGEIRWVRVRGFQVRDAADKLIRHIGIVTDITERKRAERQSNVQYSISRILSESAALEQAAPKVLQAICEILNWDVGALWTMDHRAGVLRCNEIWSAPDIHVDEFKAPSRQMTFAQGLGLPGRVWASGQSAWIRDVTQDKNFPPPPRKKKSGLGGSFFFFLFVKKGGVFLVSRIRRQFAPHRRQPRRPAGSLLRAQAR